jgi:hypothetical protein
MDPIPLTNLNVIPSAEAPIRTVKIRGLDAIDRGTHGDDALI